MNKEFQEGQEDSHTIPSQFQKSILWKAITGVSITVIIILIVSTIIIFGKFLNLLQPVLVPVAIAAILSYLLSPVVHSVRKKWLKDRNLSRTKAIVLIYSILVMISGILALAVLIPASKQLAQLVDNRASIIDKSQKEISKFSERENDQ